MLVIEIPPSFTAVHILILAIVTTTSSSPSTSINRAIHALNRIPLLPVRARMTFRPDLPSSIAHRIAIVIRTRVVLHHHLQISLPKHSIRAPEIRLRLPQRHRSHAQRLGLLAPKPLGNLDFDITQAQLALLALASLDVGIAAFLRPARAALEAAVPVVADEGFALVFLGGAVGVHVVDVREVGEELGLGEVQGVGDVEEGGAPLI